MKRIKFRDVDCAVIVSDKREKVMKFTVNDINYGMI